MGTTTKGDGTPSTTTTTPSSPPPPPPPSWWQLGAFFVVLGVDAAVLASFLLTSPGLFHYDAPGSVTWDLCLAGASRVLLLLVLGLGFDAFSLSPQRRKARPRPPAQAAAAAVASTPTPRAHAGGSPAAPTSPIPPSPIRRMERLGRSVGLGLTVVGLLLVMAKCLLRLVVGIGPKDSMAGFWLAVATGTVFACVDYVALKRHLRHVKRWAYHRHREALLRRQGTLREALLVSLVVDNDTTADDGRPWQSCDNETTASDGGIEDEGKEDQEDAAHLHELWMGIQGLDEDDAAAKAAEEGGDGGKGHATYKDLLSLARDDAPLIGLAFIFLLGAAVGQVLIPHYTGRVGGWGGFGWGGWKDL